MDGPAAPDAAPDRRATSRGYHPRMKLPEVAGPCRAALVRRSSRQRRAACACACACGSGSGSGTLDEFVMQVPKHDAGVRSRGGKASVTDAGDGPACSPAEGLH